MSRQFYSKQWKSLWSRVILSAPIQCPGRNPLWIENKDMCVCVCVCACVCACAWGCVVCVSVCVDVGLKTQARLPCLWKLSRDTFPFVRCPQMLTLSHKMLFCVLCLWLWCTSWNTMEYIFWFCLVEADYNFWWLDKNRSKKKRLLYFQQAILVAFTDAFHFAHCIKGGLWVIWKGSLSSFTEFKQAYSCISDDFLTL